MKKRIISLLLALIMALLLLPVSVLAADDHTGQVHVYRLPARKIVMLMRSIFRCQQKNQRMIPWNGYKGMYFSKGRLLTM